MHRNMLVRRKKGVTGCHKIAMILSNPFDNDPRVLKEAKTLVDNGYQVTVFAWDRECKYPREEKRHGVCIQRIRVKSSYGKGVLQAVPLTLFIFKTILRLQGSGFSVIHCHDLETLPAGLLMKRLNGCKVIFDAHEDKYWGVGRGPYARLNLWVGRALERLWVRKANHVLTVDNLQVDKYKRMRAGSATPIRNFVELPFASSHSGPRQGDAVVIGRIGTMYDSAEINLIVDAYVILKGEYPNIRLLLAGYPACDLEAVMRKMDSTGHASDIEFYTRYQYSDLEKLYTKLSVFVMLYTPSFCRQAYDQGGIDITPTKLFEAMYFGVPVVASDFGHVGRILQQDKCGIVLGELTAPEVAAAIKCLINDSELRKRMGQNAQKAIRTKYNWSVAARKMLSIYESLCQGKTINEDGHADTRRRNAESILPGAPRVNDALSAAEGDDIADTGQCEFRLSTPELTI